MSMNLFSSTLLRRLGRTVLLSGVAFLPLAACGDDDDGDDISGPLADCIDDIDFNDWFFDEGDLETLSLGDQESGSITTSDVELDVTGEGTFYYDVYAFALEEDSDLRITVNPENDLDINFEAWSLADMEGDFNDAGAEGDTEQVEYTGVAEGCYLLFVSTYEPEATGSYSVEIEEI